MDGIARRARAFLRAEPARALDPETVRLLGRTLASDPDLVRPTRHGGIVCLHPEQRARRFLELDRHGAPTAVLHWGAGGELERARVRTVHRQWIGVEAGAGVHPLWGRSDRLWRLADTASWQPLEPLALLETVRWSAIRHIPPLSDPTRLPAGAGTAVLNLVAALAGDQGARVLRYRGPFATEQLFCALLESFHFETEAADPLGEFLGAGVDWAVAPHERVFEKEDVSVQLRDGVEKAVLGGRAYYRAQWQSVVRRETHRLHRAGETSVGALWALGEPLEPHFTLDGDGRLLARQRTVTDSRPPAPIASLVRDGVGALVRATSAPALDIAIAARMARLRLQWGALEGDLVAIGGDHVRFSWRLATAGARRVGAAASPEGRVGRGLEVLVEMARLLSGALRLQAQSLLVTALAGAQRAARVAPPAAVHSAPVIARAAAALATDLGRSPWREAS